MVDTTEDALEAFCPTCPSAEDVTQSASDCRI